MPWGLGGPKEGIYGLLTPLLLLHLPGFLPQWVASGLAFVLNWKWASEVGLGHNRGSLAISKSRQDFVLLVPQFTYLFGGAIEPSHLAKLLGSGSLFGLYFPSS